MAPNNARVFVASAGSLFPGQSDIITSFTPAGASQLATGLGLPTIFTYPNVGPIDSTGHPQWFCSYLPDFVTGTSLAQMYVANYGVDNDPGCAANLASTDSVSLLSTTTNTIANIAYLPAGAHPVALAETLNTQHLYVVNQGNSTVSDLSPLDLSTIATIPVGSTPVWAVARLDNQRVYVLSQGDGTLIPIDVASDTILPTQTNLSVGAGANFLLYDPHLSRLYVTNPVTGNLYIYSTTGGVDLAGVPNDTPTLLRTISMTAGSNPPCSTACSPVSVAALPDGSRFYVASYQNEANCSDPNLGSNASCIIPLLTVFNAPSMTVKPVTASLRAPSISLLSTPNFAASQYAVTPVGGCAPAPTYSPGTMRFRMHTTAASDSSHVYVSVCDAGIIADVVTGTNTISTGSNSPDTLVTDIPAPFGACSAACSSTALIHSLSTSGKLVTFVATNNFTAGMRVAISRTGTTLDGQTFTVVAAGLSPNSFSCNLNSPADAGASAAAIAGIAVPLAPLQAPVFLLAGQ
jgi:DNA-binding beta-propeller fold protein YncE